MYCHNSVPRYDLRCCQIVTHFTSLRKLFYPEKRLGFYLELESDNLHCKNLSAQAHCHVFYAFPTQERGTATEPPPRLTFSGNVTQWEIFDAYTDDYQKQVGVTTVTALLQQ